MGGAFLFIKIYYRRANLPRHHTFQGKKICYCGLILAPVMTWWTTTSSVSSLCQISPVCYRAPLSLCVTVLLYHCVLPCSSITVCYPASSITVCFPAPLSLCVTLLLYHCVFPCSSITVCFPAPLSLCVSLLLYHCVFPCSSITVCYPAPLSLCVSLLLYHCVFPCSSITVCFPAPLSLCVSLLLYQASSYYSGNMGAHVYQTHGIKMKAYVNKVLSYFVLL